MRGMSKFIYRKINFLRKKTVGGNNLTYKEDIFPKVSKIQGFFGKAQSSWCPYLPFPN
jgi:hypothetical protein